MANKKSIVWFEEVGKSDVGLVGGKGANLGEMVNASLPIPYGFIITAAAYFDFIEKAGIKVTLRQSFGLDIYAACGQLYGKYESN